WRSSMRVSMERIRSRSWLARERAEVTPWALSGSSQRSGAAACCSRSAICASRALRSVTSCTDAMVVRRLWISDAKSTATAGHPTAEGRRPPGRRLTVGSGPGRPPALPAQSGTQIPPLPRVARDEGVDPPGLRVAIDEERLHEQGEGDREEGAEGTEDVGPE